MDNFHKSIISELLLIKTTNDGGKEMKKILLVDDYPDWLEVEKEFIESFNDAECITFDKPLEALRYLREGNHVDIIITDYQMPIIDGLELAQRVADEFPNIKIIISSGYDTKRMEEIRYSCGIEDKVDIISKSNIEFLKNLFDEK
ncbi:MAG: response regulator [Clostridiales bacterium]|nr:response regulator [Clostridiales bacterium]